MNSQHSSLNESRKRKREFVKEEGNVFLSDISNCEDISQIIYRIALEPRNNFSREEVIFVIRTIEKLRRMPEYSYIN